MLTINNTTLHCELYEIAMTEKGTMGAATPKQERPLVRKYNFKNRESDDVRFGIVKTEKESRFFLQEGSAPASNTERVMLKNNTQKKNHRPGVAQFSI